MLVEQEGLLAAGVRSYVWSVTRALQVKIGLAWYEAAEVSTAGIPIRGEALGHSGRKVMLLWNERTGWSMTLRSKDGDAPVVLAQIAAGVLPAALEVAAAVEKALVCPGGSSWQETDLVIDHGSVRAELLAYGLSALAERSMRLPRPM